MEGFYALSPINRDLYKVYQELVTYEDVEIIPAERIFNEVYYQCTRIVYENNPEPDFEAVEMDIKANVGTKLVSRLVYRMMYALLTARMNNTQEVEKVRHSLEIYSDIMTRNSYFRAFIRKYNLNSRKCIVSLSPHPVAPDALKYQPLDWEEVTCGFSLEATKKVVDLWVGTEDKKTVLSLMAQYSKKYHGAINDKKHPVELEKKYHRILVLLARLRHDVREQEERGLMCAEREAPSINPKDLLKEKDNEIAMLKKANKMLRTENEELLSKLNQSRPVNSKERSFTLNQILDFGENHTDREEGRVIIKMLNFFLRNAGNSTEEERDKVDKLEHKILNPETGDNVMGNKNSFSGDAKLVNLQMSQGMSAEIEKAVSKYLACQLNAMKGNG